MDYAAEFQEASMYGEVNWRHAPKGARWWAMDSSGHAHWFMEPTHKVKAHFWYAQEVHAPTFAYSGDWRESLTERPDEFK